MATLNQFQTAKFFIARSRTIDGAGNYVSGTIGDYWNWLGQSGASNSEYNAQADWYLGIETQASAGSLSGTDINGNIVAISDDPGHPFPIHK